MAEYEKPVPETDGNAKTYWEGCRRRRLMLPKCAACGKVFFFPKDFCPHCLSQDINWLRASGKGIVHTFSIIGRPPSPPFLAEVPYVVAIIELQEGPRMMSNVIGVAPEDVRVDMPVEVVFEDVTEDITLPKFRPVK